MPSGDLDHNYYTLHHHRHYSPQSDRHPSRNHADSNEDSQYRPSPESPANSILPPTTYSPPRPNQPKAPSISTNFDNHASNVRLNRLANGALADDASPDPHEFYRQYHNQFGVAPSGYRNQPDIVVERADDGMARPAYQQRSHTSIVRPNGTTSKHVPSSSSRDGTRTSYRSASQPLETTAALNSVRSNPNLSSASRAQQPSLKDLVNRFNQTRDERVPLPSQKPRDGRYGSSTATESSHARARKSSGYKPTTSSSNDQTSKATRSTQRSRYTMEDNGSTVTSSRPSKTERPKPTPLSPVVHYASRSMTHLPQVEDKSLRRPLFGEVLAVGPGAEDLGYGIPGFQRRGSESNVPSPDPSFHKRSRSNLEISPSSPTAWYLGLTPSLDGIDIGKGESNSPERSHRRAKSDVAGTLVIGYPPNIPQTASGLGVHMATVSPPELSPTASSNGTATRNQQSRIPLSTRRLSNPSDSGPSPPSTRANSSTGPRKVSPPKGQSALPKPYRRSLSPREGAPATPPRGSSRQHNLTALPSPSLKAYISLPAPKESPPLRSSRPRLPVSSANTTSGSRYTSRYATPNKSGYSGKDNRQSTEPKSRAKKIPELGGVDFAARRERIQKAFTKSLEDSQKKEENEAAKRRLAREAEEKRIQKEKEMREEKEREAQKMQPASHHEHEDDEAQEPQVNSEGNTSIVIQTHDEELLQASEWQDLHTSPMEDNSVQEIGKNTPEQEISTQEFNDMFINNEEVSSAENRLTLDTRSLPLPFNKDELRKHGEPQNDDSPTLGIPNVQILRVSTQQDPRPRSAASAISNLTVPGSDLVTPIENEPQTDEAQYGRPTSLVAPRQRTVLSQIMQMRDVSPSMPEHVDDAQSENGSIQIMLRETPVEDQEVNHSKWSVDSRRNSLRWSKDSLDSSSHEEILEKDREHIMEPIGESSPKVQAEVSSPSIPQIITERTFQEWGAISPQTSRSGHTTLDSEAYNAISRVLEHYHDPSFVSPEMMHEFQQQILIESPELARQGGWDPKRVTQLYLQELARGRFASHSLTPELPKLATTTNNAPHFRNNEYEHEGGTPATTTDIEYTDTDDNTGGIHQESASEGWSSHRPSLDTGDDAKWQSSRASLQCRDDWTDASPSIVDWIGPQAAAESSDGNNDQEVPPTPPPKDWDALQKPSIPAKAPLPPRWQASNPDRDGAETPRVGIDERPQLPELDSVGEGLGLAIQVGPLDDSPMAPPPPPPNHSPPLPPPQATMNQFARPVTSYPGGVLSPPSPSIYSRYPPSSIFPERYDLRNTSTRKSETTYRHTISDHSTQQTGASSLTESLEKSDRCQAPTESSTKSSSPTPEERRLKKRKHVLKEIVDTEKSFHRDMTVTEEIYKGTSNACSGVTPDDIKVLFGNSDQIVAFSKTFLDALKQAVSSVYVMPKGSGGSKRGSIATTSTGNENRSSISGPELTDDEKDRKTFVGEVFGQHMARMEKVYGDYLKNHDAANKRLQKLQADKSVAIWLQECRTVAEDLTHAWSLDSLLVKPVQRILKYPLLLAQLLEETPENHPDFSAIDVAVREMTGVSHRINELKKRVDLVEKVVSRKRKESDVRSGISKAFGRRTEKLRQQVGLSEIVEDHEYNDLSAKFGTHFFQLQVVMRDVEMYTSEVTDFVERFNGYIQAIEEFIDVNQTNYPEAESKWRKFAMTMREMGALALTEHKTTVRKSVIEPMTTLLRLHDGPQKIMGKRNKRVIDYARFRSVKDKGEKPDKRTQEQAEQFTALNDTLKDELPKLFSLTAKLVGVCLENFIEIQAQWQIIWQEKLKSILDEHQVPKHIANVVEQFSGDFAFVEAQVSALGICNGSILADRFSLLSPATSNSVDRPLLKRPPTLESGRSRGFSVNGDISPSLPTPDFERRHSGGFTFSPLADRMPELPAAPVVPNRMRANSASSKPSSTPDLPSGARSFSVATPATVPTPPRPNTGRSATDFPTSSRPASGSTYFSANQDLQRSGNSPRPFSGIFSSAMPMPDSKENSPLPSRPQSPHGSPGNLNVLFLAASLFEFNIDKARKEAGYPYLTYVPGEIFDVIGEKGELWLAKNQDDPAQQVGWIWSRHFARLANES